MSSPSKTTPFTQQQPIGPLLKDIPLTDMLLNRHIHDRAGIFMGSYDEIEKVKQFHKAK